MKDVSIILCPRDNNGAFMRVFNQIVVRTRYDLSQIEIIVVDNNTDSKLKEEVAEFVRENSELCSLTYIDNSDSGGIAQACNRAIEAANSRWFVYMNTTDTYIYDPRWLQYMTGNMSEDDYIDGYRIGGTLTAGPNYPASEEDLYVQGAMFIAFTEYLKGNPFPVETSPKPYDMLNSARCLKLGFHLKSLPRICACDADASQEWHDENREVKRFLIANVGGLSQYK
jgi:glycosyltransferase involved in cell wall biosynthesis